jgi:hypothetical protein
MGKKIIFSKKIDTTGMTFLTGPSTIINVMYFGIIADTRYEVCL